MVINVNMKKFLKIFVPLLLCIGISVCFILFGKVSYDELIRPKFSPPKIVFSIVWSILYAIIFYIVYKSYEDKTIYVLYLFVLLSHTIWNAFFFGFGFYLTSLIVLLIIYFLSWVFTYFIFKRKKLYLYLNLPYMTWLLIALYLNLGVYLLN